MELKNLFITIGTLGLVVSLAVGIMIWAYTGAGSIDILFREVMPVPQSGLSADQQQLFQQGVAAYIAGQYRRSAERFSQVVQQQDCVAAVHNLGLSFANLRQDDQSARELLKAAEMYLEQGDQRSADLVKTQLLKLRERKLTRENR